MKEYLTAQEIRKRYGLSRTTLWRWEQVGKITPAKTPGGQRRYAVTDMEALFGRAKPSKASNVRCDVYCRVSTQKQAASGNLQRQKERLILAAVARGYQLGPDIHGSGIWAE